MVDYVEDPISRIVGVHWAEGDGEPDEGDYPDDPCGMFRYPSAAPYEGTSRWFIGPYQPYMIGMVGFWFDENGKRTANTIVPVGDAVDYTSVTAQYDLYYWGSGTESFTVIVEALPFGGEEGGDRYSPIGIDVYYDTNVQDITEDTHPSLTVQGDGAVSVVLEPSQGSLIFGVWGELFGNLGFGRTSASRAAPSSTRISIQCRCKFTTGGAPPPQPPGNGWSPQVHYPISPDDPRQPNAPPGSGTSRGRRPIVLRPRG